MRILRLKTTGFYRRASRYGVISLIRLWREASERLVAGYSKIPRDWAWNAPYLAIGLFALAMLVIVWGLQKREADLQRNALAHDMEWTETTMRAHLRSHQEFLQQLGSDIADNDLDPENFRERTSQVIYNSPELSVAWVNITESVQLAEPYRTVDWLEGDVLPIEKSRMVEAARELGSPVYSDVQTNSAGEPVFELYAPVFRGRAYLGTVIAVYPIRNLLARLAPDWVTEKYHLSVTTKEGVVVTTIGLRRPIDDELSYAIPFDPPGKELGLKLVVVAYRTTSELSHVVPIILIIGLSLMVVTSLWLLRNHVVRRVQVEKERDRLFSFSLDMLCILDIDGKFRRVNPAFEKILGYPVDGISGAALSDFVHEEDASGTAAQLRQLAAGTPVNFENRFRCADGRYKWLVWSVNPVIEEGFLYAVAHDISDRKQAEQALRAEYAFRKAMEESVVTGLRAIDMEGRIIYVNPAFCNMVGLSEQELLGIKQPFPYWPPENVLASKRDLEQILAGQSPRAGIETRLMRKNGERFYARLYVSPLIDSTGRQTGWMSSMNDITEPKRARAQLEASQQRFVTVLDGLDASVYVASVDSNEILFANRAFKNIFGLDAIGRNCWETTAACQPDRHLIGRGLAGIDNDTPLPRELFDSELRNAQNGRWYHLRERAIRWVDGRAVRMEIATDITDRKNMEEERRQQSQRLQQTSRLIAMGEMASSLAHELNQPLAAIANYSSGCVTRLASGVYRQEELLQAMRKASSQAERAGKIIRRVRDFVKKSEPNRAAIGLESVIEDAVGFADIEARKSSIRIHTAIADNLPPVYADSIMIEQVLLNLIRNGIDAMQGTPYGERDLLIAAKIQGQEAVEVSVVDRGHGVTDKDMNKMFEPFYTTKDEGMGMGLNICRTVVEFHNGRLWVEPNPQGGSIFRFTLPFDKQQAA